MAAEQDPPADDLDPTEDTPDADGEDTADDAADAADDWEPQSKLEAQRKISEQGKEIARLKALAELRGESDEDDAEEDDDEGDDEDEPERVSRLEAQSWTLAEQLYGEQAVGAYRVFERATRKAETPADWVGALEAAFEARQGVTTKSAEAKTKAAPKGEDQRLQPRVESNRSDGSPDSTNEGGAGKDDLDGWLGRTLKKAGWT